MKTFNVIIPAWKCENYIMECYNSVLNQIVITGWKYNIIIGVDACSKTSAVLTKNKIPHYFSYNNVGHYVMRNSMIALHPADVIGYFDADDKMLPNYIAETIKALEKDNGQYSSIVMCAKLNCDKNLTPKSGAVIENGGAMSFTREVWQAVGGFRNYRAAADTDFMRRCEMAGFYIYGIKEGLYYRRSHPNALTKRSDTGMGSEYRKCVWAEMCELRKQGIFKINPAVTKLEKRT